MNYYWGLLNVLVLLVSCNNDPSSFQAEYGPGVFNEFTVVLQTNDGGYIAAGNITETDDPNLVKLPTSTALVHYDKYGQKVKDIVLGQSGNSKISSGLPLSNGHILLAGYTTTDENIDELMLMTVNQDLIPIKIHAFNGQWKEQLRDVHFTSDNNIWLLSDTRYEADKNDRYIYLRKLTDQLELQQTILLKDSIQHYASSLIQNLDGDVMVFGYDKTDADKTQKLWHIKDDRLVAAPFNTEALTPASQLNIKWDAVNAIVQQQGAEQNNRIELMSITPYLSQWYLLGIMTTKDASSYYQYQLELREINSDSLVWQTNRPMSDATVMLRDVIVTADSGFVVVGMKDIPGEGSKGFIEKLPKPELFGTKAAF